MPGHGGVKASAQESVCSSFTFTSTQRQVEPSKRAIEAARGTSLQELGFGGNFSPEHVKLDTILVCQVKLYRAENL